MAGASGGSASTTHTGGSGDAVSTGGEATAGDGATGPARGGASSSGGAAGYGATAGASDAPESGGESGSGSEPSPSCGDGAVDPGEACDDGNHAAGDGCSPSCAVEAGFQCSAARCDASGEHCNLHVPATFRDFNAHDSTGGHPDFEPGFNSPGALQGVTLDTLDSDGKPVLTTAISPADLLAFAYMHGPAEFAEWFRDEPPSSGPIPGELVLWGDDSGHYANRWGKDGEAWQRDASTASYGPVVYGGPGGTGCETCTPSATGQCYDPCIPWPGSLQACCAESPVLEFDGNPLFFPIDSAPGILSEPRSEGKVPSQFGWNAWPWEHEVAAKLGVTTPIETATAPFPSKTHNFNFTTEITHWFVYRASGSTEFDFTSEDDLWVFLNGHLALDLGGWHVPLTGTLTLEGGAVDSSAQLTVSDDGTTKSSADASAAVADFGLIDGHVYPLEIFHASREVEGSAFRFAFSGLAVRRSLCVPAP